MSDERDPTAIVIGNLDGVHLGHQELLRRARILGGGARVVALTFWPHPASVLRPGSEPLLLTGPHERRRLLLENGADEVQVVPFSQELAGWSPERFVAEILTPLDPAVVVVGRGFTFGHRASGSPDTLRTLLGPDVQVEDHDLVCVDGPPVSSTRIREALAAGDVALAGRLLGRPYRYDSTVVVGDQRGREMGFPTANLLVPSAMAVPADGIYAGWLTATSGPDAGRHPAAISVGTNPTFDGTQRRVESYVLDRDDLQLYGVEVQVEFVDWIRGQIRYTGMPDLIEQMHRDVDAIRDLLT